MRRRHREEYGARDALRDRVRERALASNRARALTAERARMPERDRGGAATANRDPLDRILSMGTKRAWTAIAIGLVVAFATHGAAAARAAVVDLALIRMAQQTRAFVDERLAAEIEIEMAKPPPPPPEPEPPPPPPKAEEPPPPPPPRAAAEPPPPKAAEPPAAPPPPTAQAGQILAREDTKDDVVDLTNTFVTGAGTSYAGGTTSAGGTATTAVRGAAVATGTPGGTGTAPSAAPPGPDLSRAAALLQSGSTDWNCPFPAEAEVDQVDQAVVVLQVSVRPDGRASGVTVVKDPGHGFAREARICAMNHTYRTALDHEGTSIAGTTRPFPVRFDR